MRLLESATVDPWLDPSFKRIREINKQLLTGAIDYGEVAKQIAEIDNDIDLQFGMSMVVTGGVRRYNDPESILRRGIPNHIDTASVLGYKDEQIEGEAFEYYGALLEISDEESRVKLLAAKIGDNGEAELYGVDIDGALIDFTSFTSHDRAEAWLRTYAPRMMGQIDELIARHKDDDVAIIMGLKDIDISEAFLMGDHKRARLSIEFIVSHITRPDDVMPYLIDFKGMALVGGGDKGEFNRAPTSLESSYVRFDGLSCTQLPIIDEERDQDTYGIVFCARAAIGPNMSDDTYIILPIEGIKSLKSSRQEYFN